MTDEEYLARLGLLRPQSGKRKPQEPVPAGSSVLDVPVGGTRRIPDTVLRRPAQPEDTITGLPEPSMAQRHAESLAGYLTPKVGGPRARAIAQTALGGDESALPFGIGLQELVPFSPYVAEEAGRMVRSGVETGSPLEIGLGLGLGALQASPAAKPIARGAKAVGKRVREAADPEAIRQYVRQTQGLTGMPGTAVIKPKGGNWLTGDIEKQTKPLKRQFSPSIEQDIEVYRAGQLSKAEESERLGYTTRAEQFREDVAEVDQAVALNNWIDKKLNKYIRNEMGTVEDPVRKLAEQDILHFEPQQVFGDAPSTLMRKRAEVGMPTPLFGQSEMAKRWESLADRAIDPFPAGSYKYGSLDESFLASNPWLEKVPDEAMVYKAKGLQRDMGFDHLIDELRNATRADSDLPAHLRWKPEDLDKVTMEQAVKRVHDINEYRAAKKAEANEVLARNPATAPYKDYQTIPGTDKPNEKGLAWKQIKSPEPALEEGYRVVKDEPFQSNWQVVPHPEGNGFALRAANGEFASNLNGVPERKWATAEQARADISNYADVWEPDPEELYKLVDSAGNVLARGQTESKVLSQLKRSEREKALADALKYEGEVMGHCVGGYCDDVLSGRSQIFSLRDKKGEPHVTIEVEPTNIDPRDWFYNQPYEVTQQIHAQAGPAPSAKEMADLIRQHPQYIKDNEGSLPNIVQIKGKGNRAPKEEYLPFVQDFVRSGNWSRVGDIQNTGMRDITKTPNLQKWLKSKNIPHNQYVTEQEYAKYEADFLADRLNREGFEGFAAGGLVQTTDALRDKLIAAGMDPEQAMMQALRMADQVEMAGGGLAKAAKAALQKKHPTTFPPIAPLTKQEIRPMAQRISEQMTGEFVRPDPKLSFNPAGKARKTFEREKTLPVEVTQKIPARPATPVNYEELEGGFLVGVPGDPTIGGVAKEGALSQIHEGAAELKRLGDVEFEHPVQLFGGPQYGAFAPDDHFWASNIGPARGVQNIVTELGQDAPVYGQYIKMSPESSNFALHNLDALLAYMKPEQLSKSKLEKLNREIRKGSPKYGKFPGFQGFEDPVDVLLQAQMNSDLRKHIAETLMKPTVTQELGLRPGSDVLFGITEPSLRNVETGLSGFSIGRMKPGAELTESRHPTYTHDIPGLYLGQSKYPVPVELAFPTSTSYVRSQLKPGVQEFNMLKMVGPRERIDPQYIDQMKMYEELMKEYTGKKDGGVVKPEGADDFAKQVMQKIANQQVSA